MSNSGPNTAFNAPLPDTQRDRRQFPRINVKWNGVIQAPGTPTKVKIIEISEVGFAFVCDVAYQPGAELSFEISLPDPANGAQWHNVPGRLQVISSVLSREGFRSGVIVKTISSVHEQMLKSWVKIRLHE